MQGGGGHVKKSSSTKYKGKGGKKKTVEKRKHVKLYSYSSRALIRWQILFWMMAILPKKERKREKGRWRRGSCTLLYGGHRGKLQSSVTHLEYLTHCERHYFSLISRVSLDFDCHIHFDRDHLGRCINFGSENRSEGCALLRAMTMKAKLKSRFTKRDGEKRRPIMCVCRGKTRGDHRSKIQAWSEVQVCMSPNIYVLDVLLLSSTF